MSLLYAACRNCNQCGLACSGSALASREHGFPAGSSCSGMTSIIPPVPRCWLLGGYMPSIVAPLPLLHCSSLIHTLLTGLLRGGQPAHLLW